MAEANEPAADLTSSPGQESPTISHALAAADPWLNGPTILEPIPAERITPSLPDYEILGILGRGGMGIVYQARHRKLQRLVALKMVRAGSHAGPEDVRRFRTEAEAVARLQHPNIVQIYEIGEHDGLPYFSLEYCGGGSLADKIRGAPLPPRAAAQLVEILARAMHAAHQRDIIHRDLKPANVLLSGSVGELESESAEGRGPALALSHSLTPKIADFGLAKKQDAVGQTQSGAVLGTPSYMAPEQAKGLSQDIGPLADVYALGAILYECVTGRPPFQAATTLDTICQVVQDEPVPLRRLVPTTPRDLETIGHKCLEKTPGKRYASALELAEDLRRFQAGEPIQARPVGRWERSWRWCRRNPALAGTLAAVFVVLTAGISVASVLAALAAANARQARDNETRALKAEEEYRHKAVSEGLARTDAEKQKILADNHKTEALRQLAQARANLMNAQLARVEAVYERDPGRALALLNDTAFCPIDLHDAAWRFYERTCSRWQRLVFRQQEGAVPALAVSPDGKTLAIPGADRTVTLWDTDSRQVRSILRGHGGPVHTLAFSPDGTLLASGSEDNTIKLWDPTTGKERTTLAGHTSPVICLAFRSYGTLLASGSKDKTVKLWDVRNEQVQTSLPHALPITSVAFSPDGEWLACGSGGQVALWDARSGNLRFTWKGHPRVTALAWSPNGQVLASTGDDTVKLWERGSGKLRATLRGPTQAIISLAFSPDGQTVAAGSEDQTIRFWDTATQGERLVLPSAWTPLALAFCSGGRILASVAREGTVTLWDLSTGPALSTFVSLAPVTALSFSSDGKTLASGNENWTVTLWHLATGQPPAILLGHLGAVNAVDFAPQGTLLASASDDWTVALWDTAKQRPRAFLRGHREAVLAVRFSPDGTLLASASRDRTVKIWETAGVKIRSTLQHEERLICVAFGPDGLTLASGGEEGTISLWNLASGQARTWNGHVGAVMALAFSPDGKTLASGGLDKTLKFWETASGTLRLTQWQDSRILALAFRRDGKSLASGSEDQLVRLWDPTTGQERVQLRGHAALIRAVAFSPDGHLLASASQDKTVKFWDLSPTVNCATLPGQRGERAGFVGVLALNFSRDGKWLTSGGGDRRARLWDVASGQEIKLLPEHPMWVNAVAFTLDDKLLVTGCGDGKVRHWTVASGQLQATWQGHAVEKTAGIDYTKQVTALGFTPDGRLLASASLDKTVILWEAATGKSHARLVGHTHPVYAIAYQPQGKMLASASVDKTVRLWHIPEGKEAAILSGHTLGVRAVAFSPDGKVLVSASDDQTVKVWDVATRQVRATWREHRGTVQAVAFSPDGRTLASAGGDRLIILWEAATGKVRTILRGHTNGVAALAFSPDGRILASASADQTIKFWDLKQRPLLVPPRPPLGQSDPAWHAEQADQHEKNGRWFAAGFHLGQLAQARPWHLDLRLRQARAWAQAGDPERAALAFVQAFFGVRPVVAWP